VRRRLEQLFTLLSAQDGLGLNFGSGRSAHIDRIVNLDVYRGDNVDVVYDGRVIPFADATFDLVISQEVFEHIASPATALDDVARVMKPGARLFLQLPFIIGYHSIPGDYWRFSATGIRVFVESTGKFEVVESAMALGHGTGLYRIIVEFVAVTASALAGFLYRPAKLAAAILFYWIKFFDLLTPFASEPDRIAGGYYVVAVRK
jgi:SAM-dependent methyltransferase